MAQSPYQLINLNTSLELGWPASFTGGPVLLDINDINPDANNWELILPDATLVSVGQNFYINNVSAFSFYLLANDGSTIIQHVLAGEIYFVYLIDSSTSNGTWRLAPFAGSSGGITQFTAESSDSSVVISGGTVTPPGGVIDFKLPTSLVNLNDLVSPNILVATDISPLTFRTAELIAGDNILIDNGTGVSGDPIISLNPVISAINSIAFDVLTISGETISTNLVDSNIQLSTSGLGSVQINGVSIDSSGNLTGVTNLVSPKAYCIFTDSITGPSNTIVIENQVNVSGVTGSAGTYDITFTTPMNSINYGVFITLGSNDALLPFISNGYFIVRETTKVTIIVTDASGELVLSAPHGITVMIMES